MTAAPSPELLRKLAFDGMTYLKEVAPGTHAYGVQQAVGRVRAYQSSGLQPFAAARPMREVLLVGHVHVRDGKIHRIEGFNGGEGERWAARAKAEAERAGVLAPDAVVTPATALRDCRDVRSGGFST